MWEYFGVTKIFWWEDIFFGGKNDGVAVVVAKYVLQPPAIFNSIHIVDIMPTP